MPDRTTLVKFRMGLRKQQFADMPTAAVGAALDVAGVEISHGTMVDATVIEASDSTKKRGNWQHGYKLHIGTEVENNRFHSA